MSRILILMVIIFSISCNNKKADELIIGKWKCTNADVSALEKQVRNESDMMGLAMAKVGYESVVYDFYKDKTFERGTGKSGTYTLIHDNKNLVMKSKDRDEKDEEDKYEVVSISNDSLKLKTQINIILTFARVK